MNDYISFIENKIKKSINVEKITILDNSQKHKNHKSFDSSRYHLYLEIESKFLRSVSQLEAQRNIMKILKDELKKNCHYMINDFWHTKHLKKIPSKYQKLKVVSAIGMFYDLEDPSEFIKHAADALDDDGIFVAQLMCSHSMFKTNDLGNICHEHLEYYSYNSLKYLFEKNGLKIFKMSENKINGGSYRIYCKKNIKKSIKFREQASYNDIIKFIKRVKKNKKMTVDFIKKNIKLGKKIFIYGASTKGNTLLQCYGLTNKEIPYAAERSKTKWGKYTIGSGVKIISEENARKLNPDYFFVMPYGFISEFLIREKNWLKNGGKFLLPYPKLKIVK